MKHITGHLWIGVGALTLVCGTAAAQSIAVSVGVRETGTLAPLGADGGTNGGIEFVNRDLNIVPLDGGWHQVSFNFPNAQLLAFAGTTANSQWDTLRGTLEMIRIRNTAGLTDPLRVFIDEIIISYQAESFTFNFEAQPLGSLHVFQAPGFSGSTAANLLAGSSSAVSNAAAFAGNQSYELNFQFVDGDPDRWIRLTTFNTPSGPNPTLDFRGSLSFRMMGLVVPAPSAAALLSLAGLCCMRRRRR
jgi:hypothetical protein